MEVIVISRRKKNENANPIFCNLGSHLSPSLSPPLFLHSRRDWMVRDVSCLYICAIVKCLIRANQDQIDTVCVSIDFIDLAVCSRFFVILLVHSTPQSPPIHFYLLFTFVKGWVFFSQYPQTNSIASVGNICLNKLQSRCTQNENTKPKRAFSVSMRTEHAFHPSITMETHCVCHFHFWGLLFHMLFTPSDCLSLAIKSLLESSVHLV